MKNCIKKLFLVSFCLCFILLNSSATFAAMGTITFDVNPTKVGTKLNGYSYNVDIHWDADLDQSVYGYYLKVQDAQNLKRYPISTTVSTSPYNTTDDIYGLKPGYYNIYLYSIDSNYKLKSTFMSYRIYTNYNGNTYVVNTFN